MLLILQILQIYLLLVLSSMLLLLFVVSLFLLLSTMLVMAVPAHRGIAKVLQPDGSYLSLRLHGDEWLSFNTTADGYSVVKDGKGYYVYAQLDQGRLLPTEHVAHDATERSDAENQFLSG